MKQMNMYDILDRLNRIGADSPTVKAAIDQVTNFNQVTEAGCATREPVEEKYMGFSKLEKDIAKRGDVKNPAAVAASIGRKKYGKEKFQKAAAAGKKLGEEKKATVRPLKESIESVMRAMPHEFDAFTRSGELSDKLYDVLFDIYRDDMPYGVAKARTGDPYEWITKRLHQDIENWSGGALEEADMEEGNAFSYAVQKAKADGIQKGETITVGGQDYPLREGRARPDYLDFDRDGNKKEPMKKALRDKKQKQVDEEGPGLFRQVSDRLGKMVRGDKKDPNQSDAETQRLARQAKPVNEIDINLIKAAQKKSKDEPMFQKDPESERNIGKKYGYRSDADDDSDDDYDEWGERKKKKVHAPAPGEKRGRGRPRKYTADAPRKERVTAKSRKTDRTAWSKKKVGEDYDRDEYDEEGEMAKTQSRTIADAALELQAMLGDNENLPEWVQKKISLAKDYIDRARDYMKANRPDQDMEESALQAYLGKKKYGKEGMAALQRAGRDGASKDKMARIRAKHDKMDEDMPDMDVDSMLKNMGKAPGAKVSRSFKSNIDGAQDDTEAGYNAAMGKFRDIAKGMGFNADGDDPVGGMMRGMQDRVGGMMSKMKTRSGMSNMPGAKVSRSFKSNIDGAQDDTEAGYNAAMGKFRDIAKGMGFNADLEEKAVSKAQRAAAGIARAAQKGEIPKSELRGASREMARMPAGELRKFAKTKERGLPQHAKKKSNETAMSNPGVTKTNIPATARTSVPGMRATTQDLKKAHSSAVLGEKDKTDETTVAGSVAPAMTKEQTAAKSAQKPAAKPAAKKAASGSEAAVAETDADPADRTEKKSKGGMQFGKGIYDSFNRELEGMIAESLSVNTSISTEGGKSVSINATEEDADRLLDLLKMAGIGSRMEKPSCGAIEEVTDNEPDYPVNMGAEQDEVYMLQKLAGGLNGPKQQVNPNNAGDNPLAMKALGRRGSGQINVDESMQVEKSLWNLYKKVK